MIRKCEDKFRFVQKYQNKKSFDFLHNNNAALSTIVISFNKKDYRIQIEPSRTWTDCDALEYAARMFEETLCTEELLQCIGIKMDFKDFENKTCAQILNTTGNVYAEEVGYGFVDADHYYIYFGITDLNESIFVIYEINPHDSIPKFDINELDLQLFEFKEVSRRECIMGVDVQLSGPKDKSKDCAAYVKNILHQKAGDGILINFYIHIGNYPNDWTILQSYLIKCLQKYT